MLCNPAISVRNANVHSFQVATVISETSALPPISQNGRSEVRCRLSTITWFTTPVSRCNMKFQVRIPAYAGSA
jgi:hypothetical protein